MPPSPALRSSPARELRAENHKRGHSLESGLHLKDKDDDLSLFNDMHSREKDNFLLPSADDFDDSLSMKLRYFSDFKLGISIPARGESSDLLNADGEKTDYDWLLTPPDTPLFPSLDDEPAPINLSHRGRPRSQPISISRSATTEKSYRNSRSSASPHRLSPSPQSGNSTFRSRGRPSSAPNTSVSPILRPSTPSRRPSTPPNKPVTPAPRSSTPTVRRNNTGSGGGHPSTSGRSGPSPPPVKASRGNSASPKLRAWQSNLPGFSSDPPPNLRTSLSDRPALHARGLSPASSNGRDTPIRARRQSMSPTVSRSASSSHSHDRDKFSSHSKGSAMSSCEDDMDSVQSVFSGKQTVSDRTTPRKNDAFLNSRPTAFPKKPSRTLTASSAPKRSFDSALRQMDHRKSPQNMFRPLLSSVPTTTFYVGKAGTSHRPMISMNSSVTTSSNASSEQAASMAPDTEGSDHDQDDLVNECGKVPYPNAQEEVFVFDKTDGINEGIGNDCTQENVDLEGFGVALDSASTSIPIDAPKNHDTFSIGEPEPKESEKLSNRDATEAISRITVGQSLDAGDAEMVATCSKCGKNFHIMEMHGLGDICLNCARKGEFFIADRESAGTSKFCTLRKPRESERTMEENDPVDQLGFELRVNELLEKTHSTPEILWEQEKHVEWVPSYSLKNHLVQLKPEKEEQLPVDLIAGSKQKLGFIQSDSDTSNQQLEHFNTYPSPRVDGSEGTGISVLLLKKSSSSKWPVVQGRAFTATNIPCDDPLYVRDSANARSTSASPAIDVSLTRQTEARVQRQLSSQRADMENARNDSNVKVQSAACSPSGIANNAYKSAVQAKRTSQENFVCNDYVVDTNAKDSENTQLFIKENSNDKENAPLDAMDSSTVHKQDKFDLTDKCGVIDNPSLERSKCKQRSLFDDTSGFQDEVYSSTDDGILSGNTKENSMGGISEKQETVNTSVSSIMVEDSILDSSACGVDVPDADTPCPSDMILGEQEKAQVNHMDSQSDFATSPNEKSAVEAFQETSTSATSEKEVLSAPESDASDHALGIKEEQTVKVEGPKGNLLRSLTFEEATDTILFCSSIVHSLAYKAASIAMEKENLVPLEGSRLTVTILDKSSPDRRDPRTEVSGKRTLKSRKTKARHSETDFRTPSMKTETEEKTQESLGHDSTVSNKLDCTKPPKLESKCNCSVM